MLLNKLRMNIFKVNAPSRLLWRYLLAAHPGKRVIVSSPTATSTGVRRFLIFSPAHSRQPWRSSESGVPFLLMFRREGGPSRRYPLNEESRDDADLRYFQDDMSSDIAKLHSPIPRGRQYQSLELGSRMRSLLLAIRNDTINDPMMEYDWLLICTADSKSRGPSPPSVKLNGNKSRI